MTGEVARKGGCDEVSSLIRDPIISINPFDAAVLGRGIWGRPGPGEHSDFANGQTSVGSCHFCSHDLNDSWNERKTIGVVRGLTRIARLPKSGKVANGTERAPSIIGSFGSPASAGRFMDRRID